MLKKILLTFTFVLYAVILLLVLLVVRFPKDSILARIEQKVERELPGYSCNINNIRYVYPLSVKLEGVTAVQEARQFQLPVTDILITPTLGNILSEFDVSLELFGGYLSTTIVLDHDSNRVELPSLLINGIDLNEVLFLEQSLGRGVDGRVEITGRFIAESSRLNQGEFSGSVRINEFQMELKRPILQSRQVEFAEINSAVQVKSGRIELADGEAKGPLYDADFTGTIVVKRLWRASDLNSVGTITPRQEYLEKNRQVARTAALLYKKYKRSTIPFTLYGTLEAPVFAFGSK